MSLIKRLTVTFPLQGHARHGHAIIHITARPRGIRYTVRIDIPNRIIELPNPDSIDEFKRVVDHTLGLADPTAVFRRQ